MDLSSVLTVAFDVIAPLASMLSGHKLDWWRMRNAPGLAPAYPDLGAYVGLIGGMIAVSIARLG